MVVGVVKYGYEKKIKMILIVFGVIVFVWYGYVGTVKYINWKWWQRMKNEAANFEKEIADKKRKLRPTLMAVKLRRKLWICLFPLWKKAITSWRASILWWRGKMRELEDLRESEKKTLKM